MFTVVLVTIAFALFCGMISPIEKRLSSICCGAIAGVFLGLIVAVGIGTALDMEYISTMTSSLHNIPSDKGNTFLVVDSRESTVKYTYIVQDSDLEVPVTKTLQDTSVHIQESNNAPPLIVKYNLKFTNPKSYTWALSLPPELTVQYKFIVPEGGILFKYNS